MYIYYIYLCKVHVQYPYTAIVVVEIIYVLEQYYGSNMSDAKL